jgi:hypothetical protein
MGIRCAGYSIGGGNMACVAMSSSNIEVWKVSKSTMALSDRVILEDISGVSSSDLAESALFRSHMSINVANNVASVGYGVVSTNIQIAHFDVLGFTASDAVRVV